METIGIIVALGTAALSIYLLIWLELRDKRR